MNSAIRRRKLGPESKLKIMCESQLTEDDDYSAGASGEMAGERPVKADGAAPGPGQGARSDTLSLIAPENPERTRIDLLLSRMVPQFSRARLQEWLEAGRVTVDGASAGAKTRVKGGEQLEIKVAPDPEETAFSAENIPLDIVFEDATLIVLNKPAGLVVHPAAGNWSGTALNGLLHHAPQLAGVPRAGIVHRLDKETTGLMVVAKTVEAQTHLVRQLQAHTVKRNYLAVVAGQVRAGGTVNAPIGRHPSNRMQMAVLRAEDAGAKAAVTHYAPRALYARGASLIECRLETGRTHQIRVHMRHIGHALVGDQVYGTQPSRSWFGRQALHAQKLALTHPNSGREVAFEAAPPADLAELINQMEKE